MSNNAQCEYNSPDGNGAKGKKKMIDFKTFCEGMERAERLVDNRVNYCEQNNMVEEGHYGWAVASEYMLLSTVIMDRTGNVGILEANIEDKLNIASTLGPVDSKNMYIYINFDIGGWNDMPQEWQREAYEECLHYTVCKLFTQVA